MHLVNKKPLPEHSLNIWLTKAIQPAVLLVDDSVEGRSSLAEGLRKLGSIEVLEVGTSLEAVQALQRFSFDVLVFALSDWEEGVQIYIDALLERSHPFQLILYVPDLPDPPVFLSSPQVRIVRKPDLEKLLQSVLRSFS
jgi:CheY-like chemotaxis protein